MSRIKLKEVFDIIYKETQSHGISGLYPEIPRDWVSLVQ